MSKFDSLLQAMQKRGASRAVLVADQPMVMEVAGAKVQGALLPQNTLESLLSETLPFDLYPHIFQQGQFEHSVQLPTHDVRLIVSRNGTSLSTIVELLPAGSTVSPPLAANATPNFNKPPVPNAPPPAPNSYGMPLQTPQTNTSGMGLMSQVPPEILGKWNWGAFFWTWIWGIAHSSWLTLLVFVPCVGLIFSFVAGFKGNEWAWRNRRFESVEQFNQTQRMWGWTGLIPVAFSLLFVLPVFGAILFPVFGRASENARRSSCQSNLKQIGLGIILHTQANNDKFPVATDMGSLKSVILPQVNNKAELFQCPSHSDSSDSESYIWNPKLSGIDLASIENAASLPMVWEDTAHLEGHNVLFADGHVKWFRKETFDQLMKGG